MEVTRGGAQGDSRRQRWRGHAGTLDPIRHPALVNGATHHHLLLAAALVMVWHLRLLFDGEHPPMMAEQGGCRGSGYAHGAVEASQSASLAGIHASPPSPAGDAQLISSFRGFLATWVDKDLGEAVDLVKCGGCGKEGEGRGASACVDEEVRREDCGSCGLGASRLGFVRSCAPSIAPWPS